MPKLTKQQLKEENTTLFPTNTSGEISAADLRIFNVDMIDSLAVGDEIPPYSTSTPIMDGTASVGTSNTISRGDHIHPKDTSKQDKLVAGTGITIGNNNVISSTGGVPLSNSFPSAVSDFNVAGTGGAASRFDHQHQIVLKTINSQGLLGSGNIQINSPTAGSAIPQQVTSAAGTAGTSSSFARDNHRHQLQLKTINNNSLFGSGNIVITGQVLSYFNWGSDSAETHDIISNSFVIGKLASTRLMSMSYTIGKINPQSTAVNSVDIALVLGKEWNAGVYYWIWENYFSSEMGLDMLAPKQIGFYSTPSMPNTIIPFYGIFNLTPGPDFETLANINISGINNLPLLPANATAYIDMWLPAYDWEQ